MMLLLLELRPKIKDDSVSSLTANLMLLDSGFGIDWYRLVDELLM